MANFQVLIMNTDDPGEQNYKRGDIVKVKKLGEPWGSEEGPPRYRVVELDEDDYHDIKNLEKQDRDTDLSDFPVALRFDVKNMLRYVIGKKRNVRSNRRYRVNPAGKVEDKKRGGKIVERKIK